VQNGYPGDLNLWVDMLETDLDRRNETERTETGVSLFVYNRPGHTKRTLQGLKNNRIGKLYVFCDGPKGKSDGRKVEEVRSIVASVDWCETEIVTHDENIGLAESIVFGLDYVLSRNARAIVLEDDCVPAGGFVGFMERCFSRYENVKRIMSVSGYSPPIKIPRNYPYDIYFSYRSSSWGWGTWKDRWRRFDRDPSITDRLNVSSSFRDRLDRAGRDLYPMLESQLDGKIDSWSIFWTTNIVEANGLCINPVISRINNIGVDGSGVHCRSSDRYVVRLENGIREDLEFPPQVMVDKRITGRLGDFFSGGGRKSVSRRGRELAHLAYRFPRRIKRGVQSRSREDQEWLRSGLRKE